MNLLLLAFEEELALGPTFAARMLGVAYGTYAHYRSGMRELPNYQCLHIETLMRYPKVERALLIKDRLHATSE